MAIEATGFYDTGNKSFGIACCVTHFIVPFSIELWSQNVTNF